MKLSVIIPAAAGREDNLRLVLASLALQTFPKRFWEVIVASDGDKAAAASVQEVLGEFKGKLSGQAIHSPRKGLPDGGGHARNAGVKAAKHDFFVFLDSDVVLQNDALAYYAEDWTNMANRVVAGLYHWLPPMEVTQEDLAMRFEELLAGNLPRREVDKVSHNVGHDGRQPFFERGGPDKRFTAYQRFLGCLTGNLGVPRKIYEAVGGFREDLPGGVDGAFGMEVYRAGYTCSYDYRIVGGHLYHPRDTKYMEERHDEMRKKLNESYHADSSWMGRGMSIGD